MQRELGEGGGGGSVGSGRVVREETLRAVFNAIDDVIYVSDPETYELLLVNTAFEKIFGKDHLGAKCYSVLQGRDGPCPFCTNDKIFGEHAGRTWVWEFQNERTGDWFRCSDKAIPWTDGRLVRFELAGNITPLKNTEAALQRSNKELELFAYFASHDLQEPLRMVSAFTQLLGDRYGDGLDERARQYIGFAVDGANRMQQLIQDLLNFSRVDTHGEAPEPIDSKDALDEALLNLDAAIDEAGARIDVGDLPLVLADSGQLARVFQNLVGNAIKFRREDAAPHIHVAASRTDDATWTFSVTDNGIGIEPRFAERVFQIFQRLHGREQYAGTGMGLALCKRIVERHGGRIWVESRPEGGSTFCFTLSATTTE